MLVLTRKVGEEIVLPTCRLTMTVLNIAGERAKFGISAPLAWLSIARRYGSVFRKRKRILRRNHLCQFVY